MSYEKTMPNSIFKEENENSNHIRESARFCEYLGNSFAVKYSKLGIIYFRCPMYSKNNQDDIVCLELRTPDCHVRDRLDRLIEKL